MTPTKPIYYMIANLGTLLASPTARRYSYHMVLAQPYASSGAMRSIIEAMISVRGTEFILDNGAHEGEVMDDDEYMQVVKSLKPECVVLPDLIGRPWKESRDRSIDFDDKLRSGLVNSEMRRMFVPQGDSKEGILAAVDWACSNLDPDQYTIGLGQSYLTWETETRKDEAARAAMILDIRAQIHPSDLAVSRFHLLGGRWSPVHIDMMAPKGSLLIVGLDSIKPCTCALNQVLYPERPENNKTDFLDERIASEHALSHNMYDFCRLYGLDCTAQTKSSI